MPRGTDSARVIQVIETRACRGNGTKEDPCRVVIQYWNLAGEILAEKDTINENDVLIRLESEEDKKCKNCVYWIEDYCQCEHPGQIQEACGEYMAPPEKTCELWKANR